MSSLFSNENLEHIKDPKKFPAFITNMFKTKIKEIIFYKPDKYTIKFLSGKVGYLHYYGPSVQRTRRPIKTGITVEGDVEKGLKLLDAAHERSKCPSIASYNYNKFISEFNSRMRGEGVRKRLSRGSRGTAVGKLQVILNSYSKAFGTKTLKVDELFGPRTYDSVKWFQFFNGCKIDGIVGHETWTAIDKNEKFHRV